MKRDRRPRHPTGTAAGVTAGILVAALAGIAALAPVYYLTDAAARALRAGQAAFAPAPAGLAYLAAVAVLVTLLSARPAAALACGLPLAAAGALFALDLDAAIGAAGTLPWAHDGGLPWQAAPGGAPWAEPGEPPGTLAGTSGLYALLGALLVLPALLPARWRSILNG
ncbi:hypothetical protein [Nonomuraea candida]|uniref:hypothetical protein n=1 Tax=Nonomuraea candida TaxID=359159 RepID=UPI0005BA8512|nr:hypothetical protein [Nonomuraea candida]